MNLLPLEVLPGWPEPEPASDLWLLMLTVIGPLAFTAIVALLCFAPKFRSKESSSSTELERQGDA